MSSSSKYFLAAMIMLCSAYASAQNVTSKKIELAAFNKVSFETVGDLVIEHGDKHSLTIAAEPKVLALINAKIEHGKLRIFASGNFKTNKPISLHLRVQKLNELIHDSSGDVQLEKFTTDELDLILSGSGTIKSTNINAKRIKVNLTGSGDVELLGRVESLNASIEGSGNIDASKLTAATAIASIDGSGDILVRVSNKLKASINGAGTISYYGNPKLETSVQGAGDIIKQD